MSLFGSASAGGGAQAAPPSGNLIEFKAGKMTMSGSTVTAQKEKGKIIIKKSDMGYGVDFIWQNRSTGARDDPIVLFPGDAQFRKCKSCKEGRVCYLKLVNRREFFWLQEADESKDADLIKKTDDVVNGRQTAEPATPAATSSPAARTGGASHIQLPPGIDPELRSVIESLGPDVTQEDVMSMLGLGGMDDSSPVVTESPHATPAGPAMSPTRTPTNPQGPAAAGLAPSGGAAQGGGGATGPLNPDLISGLLAGIANAQAQRRPGADLADILTPEAIQPLLADTAAVERLTPFLPEGSNTSAADILANLRSPQFAQAMHSFSAALNSGEFEQAMAQLGVDPAVVAAGGGGVQGLIHALQQRAEAEHPQPMDQGKD